MHSLSVLTILLKHPVIHQGPYSHQGSIQNLSILNVLEPCNETQNVIQFMCLNIFAQTWCKITSASLNHTTLHVLTQDQDSNIEPCHP